jgi:hypothetical protein
MFNPVPWAYQAKVPPWNVVLTVPPTQSRSQCISLESKDKRQPKLPNTGLSLEFGVLMPVAESADNADPGSRTDSDVNLNYRTG